MILSFIIGFVWGIICCICIACSAAREAVRRGTWIHDGKAYQLKELKPNKT